LYVADFVRARSTDARYQPCHLRAISRYPAPFDFVSCQLEQNAVRRPASYPRVPRIDGARGAARSRGVGQTETPSWFTALTCTNFIHFLARGELTYQCLSSPLLQSSSQWTNVAGHDRGRWLALFGAADRRHTRQSWRWCAPRRYLSLKDAASSSKWRMRSSVDGWLDRYPPFEDPE